MRTLRQYLKELCAPTKEADDEFLSRRPINYRREGYNTNIRRGSRFSFILNSGTVIDNAVYAGEYRTSTFYYTPIPKQEGESIKEALIRHDCVDTVIYIIERMYGIRTVDRQSRGKKSIIWKITS